MRARQKSMASRFKRRMVACRGVGVGWFLLLAVRWVHLGARALCGVRRRFRRFSAERRHLTALECVVAMLRCLLFDDTFCSGRAAPLVRLRVRALSIDKQNVSGRKNGGVACLRLTTAWCLTCARIRARRAFSAFVGIVARRGVGVADCFLHARCLSRRVRYDGCADVSVPNDVTHKLLVMRMLLVGRHVLVLCGSRYGWFVDGCGPLNLQQLVSGRQQVGVAFCG